MESKRRLIVDADDLGISPGVNRGIIEAHSNGVVTSASLMVNLPASQAASALVRSYPDLEIGLHLNLTCGSPVTDAPLLAGADGLFLSPPKLSARLLLSRKARQQAGREIDAQLDTFLSQGLRLTHICGHHHIHIHPLLVDRVAAIAVDLGVPVRLPIGFPAPKPWRGRFGPSLAIWLLSARARRVLRKAAIARPAAFAGHLWRGRRSTTAALLRGLHELPLGTSELMCHPGYDDEELRNLTTYNDTRLYELKALTDPSLKLGLAELGIAPGRWRDLGG